MSSTDCIETIHSDQTAMLLSDTKRYGAVVIGRNEGDRLKQCFNSLLGTVESIVYVDSGSSDGSVDLAMSLPIFVICLDMNIPFTAARARNAGAAELLRQRPEMLFIQFIDADCELHPDWVNKAVVFLSEHPQHAIVCGRRRERFPEQSVYNKLCDMEWNTPVGDTHACGGDALIRVEAYLEVNGYSDQLIAGEEPEMCFRMRQQGWKIRRLDAEMTIHDAAMKYFGQWWKRAQRAGHAYAEGYVLHGRSNEGYRQRELFSIFVWTIVLPLLILAIAIVLPWGLILFLVYPLQVFRLTLHYCTNRNMLADAFFYALSNIGGKFAQVTGIGLYLFNRMTKRSATLIEYK